MGDPQCDRISADHPDYSRWKTLLGIACREAGGAGTLQPPLLVLGGDLVNHPDREEEWSAFLQAGGELLASLPVLVPTGNHTGLRTDRLQRLFHLPANGPAGYEDAFFSYDHGCCHFLVLDTNYMGTRREEGIRAIRNWIEADLAAAASPVTAVVMHHPIVTVGTSLDDDVRAAQMSRCYLPLLDRYGVDLILCGHQHVYCRSRPLRPGSDLLQGPERPASDEPGRGPAARPDPGMIQLMGVSGTKYFVGRDTRAMEAVHPFVSAATVCRTDGKTLSLKTVDPQGRVIDEITRPVRPKPCRGPAAGGAFPGSPDSFPQKGPECSDPFCPTVRDGIEIRLDGRAPAVLSAQRIGQLPQTEQLFSVRRRGRLRMERKRGVLLMRILEEAGWRRADRTEHDVLLLTSADGLTSAVSLPDILKRRRFPADETEEEEAETVLPLLIEERNDRYIAGYRLITGQAGPGMYNGREWKRNIVSLELTDLRRIVPQQDPGTEMAADQRPENVGKETEKMR